MDWRFPIPIWNTSSIRRCWGHFRFRKGELGEFRERLGASITKSAREAKVHTSWSEPDADYESALEIVHRLHTGRTERVS